MSDNYCVLRRIINKLCVILSRKRNARRLNRPH